MRVLHPLVVLQDAGLVDHGTNAKSRAGVFKAISDNRVVKALTFVRTARLDLPFSNRRCGYYSLEELLEMSRFLASAKVLGSCCRPGMCVWLDKSCSLGS